jgi:hypothetical protein
MEHPVMTEPFLPSQVAREQAKDLAAGKKTTSEETRRGERVSSLTLG